MKKNFLRFAYISIIASLGFFVITNIVSNQSSFSTIDADEDNYVLSFDKDHNRLGSNSISMDVESGSGNVTTNLGNNVSFAYTGFTNITTQWQSICVGGSFYNITAISGMKSISLKRGNNTSRLSISWSGSSDFNIFSTFELEFDASNSTSFNFNDEHPNYFKIFNSDESKKALITSFEISYSCFDQYKTLIVNSEKESMGSVSGSGVYHIGRNVTIHASSNKGYKFIGWYKDDAFVSNDEDYTFLMHEVDSIYTAKFTYISYNVVINKNLALYGEVTGAGTYDYLSSVTVSATANLGYRFIGWYIDSTLMSSDLVYTFTMPYNDLTLLAKFEIGYFDAKAVSEDTNLGTVSGSINGTYNTEVSFIATPVTGYSFAGWYDDNDVLVTTSNPFNFNMPNNDITYTAKWSTNGYSVTLTKNNDSLGNVEVIGGSSHLYKSEVTIVSSTSNPEEYTFGGWYQDDTLVSLDEDYTFTMPYNDIVFEARYVRLYEVFIYYCEGDSSMGTFVGQGKYGEGLSYTIQASSTKSFYQFNGWYDKSKDLVSLDSSYTSVMPGYDVYYYASFGKAILPLYSSIEFGSYPQSKVTDSSITDSLTSLAGTLPNSSNSYSWTSYDYYISGSNTTDYMWYIDINHIDGYKYRGVYFTSYRPYDTTYSSSAGNSFQYDNGYSVSNLYWFRYDPISWKVSKIDGDNYMLISNIVLDSTHYYQPYSESRTIDSETIYPNNYKHSDVRTFLNNDFYNLSFDYDEKNMILTTEVDNSVTSTGYSSNSYSCENTFDKVFLLSYIEATDSNLGFNSDTSRRIEPSEYAKCQGVYYYSDNNSCYWWLRSPSAYNSNFAWCVYEDGNANYDYVYCTLYGVLPALYIAL